MKDKNGIEISLGKIARYLGEGWNRIVENMRIIHKHPIPSDPDYILSLDEIKHISMTIYTQLLKHEFELPKLFQININELENELSIKIGKMYYSEITKKFYLYRGWSNSYYTRDISDFKFTFETATRCGFIIRKSPFDYGESKYENIEISKIRELRLEKFDCVYIDLGDCFYSPDKNMNVRYTCKGVIGYSYFFENEWEEHISFSLDELKNLQPIKPFTNIRLKNIKIYAYENLTFSVYREYISDYYRGEDSGARYPEYEEEYLCSYDFSTLRKEYEAQIQKLASGYPNYITGEHQFYKVLLSHPELCVDGTPTHEKYNQ